MKLSDLNSVINKEFLPPESLVLAVEPLLPLDPPKPKGGRPRQPNWQMFVAMWYILRSGCQWKALPRGLGASSTVHDRFQAWVQAGVFRTLWAHGLLQLDIEGRLDLEWLSLDGCMTKAPLAGEATGANPTDRGKTGTKRHLLTEAQGIPLSITVTGANVHDSTQVEDVLIESAILLPLSDEEWVVHLCADKGYDYERVRSTIQKQGLVEHIKSRGDEKQELKTPGYRARRWVNERTHSWMNRFRRILIRWEKKIENYKAFLFLSCAAISWRKSQVFG